MAVRGRGRGRGGRGLVGLRELSGGLPALDGWAWLGRLAAVVAVGWIVSVVALPRKTIGAGVVALAVAAALWSWIRPPPQRMAPPGVLGAPEVSQERPSPPSSRGVDVWSPGSRPPAGDEAPDVILLTIDTWREDAASWSARSLDEALTPNLATRAEGAVRYGDAVAPVPLTGPSHASLLSGRQPWTVGLLRNGQPVPADLPWVPAELVARGYSTAAFVSSAMLDADLGFDRGFAVYDDDLDGRATWRRGVWVALSLPRRSGVAFRAVRERPGSATLARVEHWLRRAPDGPLFLWVHLYEPHAPYEPPEEHLAAVDVPPLPSPRTYADHPSFSATVRPVPRLLRLLRREAIAAGGGPAPEPTDTGEPPDEAWYEEHEDGIRERARVYLGEVRHADALAAELFALLDETRAGRPRAWVVAGDHGESLTEHHEYGSHQFHVYEANLRVPLVVSPAAGVEQAVVEDPAGLEGLSGTLVALTGAQDAPFPCLPGPDAVRLVAAETMEPVAVARGPDHGGRAGSVIKVAVRQGPYKLVACGGMGDDVEQAGWREWYDLGADPHEIHPLTAAAVPADVRAMLEAQYRAVLDQARMTRRDPQPVPLEVRQALEALGYVE